MPQAWSIVTLDDRNLGSIPGSIYTRERLNNSKVIFTSVAGATANATKRSPDSTIG